MPWPLRLPFRGPTAVEVTERFDAVRAWVSALAGTPQVRLEWREWRHRIQGTQRLPAAVWIDRVEDALAWIGKRQEAQRFVALRKATADRLPALLPWIDKRPLHALELADRWPRLLGVVGWMLAHPRPAVYLRQVDVLGVDSKFIEAHRTVLAELFDLALPAASVDATASGASGFVRRYGFLDKPVRIRFRVLDAGVPILIGEPRLADVTLDSESFAALDAPVDRIFVVENETNFLAFPPLPRALVVFGSGYGWDALSRANWLHRCALFYWGDIDTHGFAILDRLREGLPHAVSILMDRATLLAHEAHWGEEHDPVRHDLSRLTADEHALYEDLRCDRLRPHLRLEQERVRYAWFLDHVAAVSMPAPS
jgi:hypothetical protein